MQNKRPEDIIANDFAWNLFLSILALLLLLFAVETSSNSPEETPGELGFYIQWPDGLDVDIDLWVKPPGLPPIGYSNDSGPNTSLLKDDLGNVNDSTPLNFEFSYARVPLDGEYIVNIHYFRGSISNVPIRIIVFQKTSDTNRQLFAGEITLSLKQEKTAIRLTFDAKSVIFRSTLQEPIRSWKKPF